MVSALEDEIYRRYRCPDEGEVKRTPCRCLQIQEDNHFRRQSIGVSLRNSLVSPTLLSGIQDAKYEVSSAMPSGTGIQRMGCLH